MATKLLRALVVVGVGCFAGCAPDPGLELEPAGLGAVVEGGSDGPPPLNGASPHRVGDATRGAQVFRYETFGNERFWSGAAGLPQGLANAQLTPTGALRLGLSFDLEAIDAPLRAELVREIDKRFLAGPLMNSPATFRALLESNAVMGLVVKDADGDGRLQLAAGDPIGVSCALCHAITDARLIDNPAGGSVGLRVDGPAPHTLNTGALFALAANTRAFFPLAKVRRADGSSVGKGAPIGPGSSEAEVDAYFEALPRGTFDETPDGVGNAVRHAPVFRADRAAPWGSAGEESTLDAYTNAIITVTMDPTRLLTPGGRAYLRQTAGPAGERLADDYAEVLAATGVTGSPFVDAPVVGAPGAAETPAGVRVEEQKLVDLNAYLNGLSVPRGAIVDSGAADRGRVLFRAAAGCTACHNVSQAVPVPGLLVPMKAVFPGDAPSVVGVREAPMGPVLDTAQSGFDDRMIFFNAGRRGLARGVALPVLADLARKPAFLHDDSVPTLEALLDPARGASAPHPFYVADPKERTEVVRFLERLDDTR